MVDWKKEIKLSDLVGGKSRKGDDEPEAEEKPEKTSIWKKEITFGRRKGEAVEPAAPPEVAHAEPAAEYALQVEPPAPAAVSAPAPAPTPEPAFQAPDAAAASAHTSQPPVLQAPAEAAPPPEFVQAARPEPRAEEPAARHEPVVQPPAEAPAPEVAEPAAEAADEPPREVAEPVLPVRDEQPGSAAPVDADLPRVPAEEPAAHIAEMLALARGEEPSPEVESDVRQERVEQPAPDAGAPSPPSPGAEAASLPGLGTPDASKRDAPAPSTPSPTQISEPVSVSQPAAAAPIPAAPAPPPQAAHSETSDQTPVAPQAPSSQPAEPEIVHPPVPADQLPPVDDEERKPFYKRNISFGRRQPKEGTSKRQRTRRQDAAAAKKLSKSVVGLKVGASQIAAARVENNGHAELIQVARDPLDPGIVVAGELRDPDSLAEALKAFFAKHKLPKRGVRLGIANNRIGVRAFEISGVDDPRQLANAIRFRAQEVLPVPIEEAVLDYQVLAERVTDEGEIVRKILLVVAYRELVDRYLDACRKAGITLVGIDLEGFALLRSLHAPREEADGDAALVAVTIGHDRSTFAVSDGRTCEFTRVLEWGGAALNVAIARALDMSPTEAEPIKLEMSLLGGEVPAGLSEAHAGAAREAMGHQIQSFARELVSSLQFYQNQPGSLGIGEIAITGGTANLPGLAQELQRLIGVTVRVGDPLGRVKIGKKFREPEQVGSLAVAIGLGIED